MATISVARDERDYTVPPLPLRRYQVAVEDSVTPGILAEVEVHSKSLAIDIFIDFTRYPRPEWVRAGGNVCLFDDDGRVIFAESLTGEEE